MSGLWRETITIIERLGEDASGNPQTARSSHEGAYAQVTAGERRRAVGPMSANAGTVFLKPNEFGETWSLKPGDQVIARGNTLSVLGVNPVMDPRTQTLHHLEVDCG